MANIQVIIMVDMVVNILVMVILVTEELVTEEQHMDTHSMVIQLHMVEATVKVQLGKKE